MRIIAGECRNRRIQALPGAVTRPTPDRVREALFNILAPDVPESHFLDLYAGSGANGIEALSRGASSATFIEESAAAVRIVRTNLQNLRLTHRATVLHQSLPRAIGGLEAPAGGYNLVFADPPYGAGDYAELLEAIDASRILARDGRIIVEHSTRVSMPEAIGGLTRGETRKYGDTVLTFFA